jgi:hypothetical protein
VPESIDDGSGEVYQSDAEARVVALMTPDELVHYTPVTPAEMEEFIYHLGLMIERAPSVIAALYEAVHRKTEKYQAAFSDAVLDKGGQISFAREYAKKKTAPLLNELNVAKESLRYAEELQKALVTRYYGALNINKAIAAQFMGQSRY